MIQAIMCVGAGSMVGGIARYLISKLINESTTSSFPWSTFVVNLIGCLLIGIFCGIFERGNLLNPHLRLFLTVGICGGFTTFSTFINESYQLLRFDNILYFSLYAGLSVALGLLMVYLGFALIKLL